MKKTLLLSVVASTMIMAGGDIAPVEPVVETPAPVAAPVATSGWDFAGKGVVYYQTNDTIVNSGAGPVGDLFSQEASAADAGVQLSATNKDVVAGIGAGFEVSGLATLGLENDVVSNVMQQTNGNLQGGWISQAYLTYGAGNTSFKAGRQTLPKALSPFAYSENWNVFHNTFDSVLVVNSDLPDTTLVGAWVRNNNVNVMHADMADFGRLNSTDGVYMLTAQNKSIDGLTLTGSFYYGQDMAATDDLTILWGDAAYNAGSFGIAVQGGSVMSDAFADNLTAVGGKLTGSVMGLNAMVAYTTTDSGTPDHGMFQVGGSTSALYSETALDQVVGTASFANEDKVVASLGMNALGGNITAVYANSTNDHSDYNEADVVYSTNLTNSVNLTAAYVYADLDALEDPVNLVRVVGSYKF